MSLHYYKTWSGHCLASRTRYLVSVSCEWTAKNFIHPRIRKHKIMCHYLSAKISIWFSLLVTITEATYFFLTYPKTVVHVWDVLLGSQWSTVFQSLLQLLNLNLGQTKISDIGLKVNFRLAIFGPLRQCQKNKLLHEVIMTQCILQRFFHFNRPKWVSRFKGSHY